MSVLEAGAVGESRWGLGRILRGLLGLEMIILLAMTQVIFAGYGMGVGNQSIQIPFLRHWIDPTLYANDAMVQQTKGDYPSFFFRLLALAVGKADLSTAYFWLHVGTSVLVLLAAYGLGRAMFRDRASGIVLILLMLAGHHRALAGDELYSLGFTHTWAVFPVAIFALMLLYRQWYWAAFGLVGIIFNLHALTAGYLVVMFLAWAVVDYRAPGWKWKLPLMVLLFLALASPTLREMLMNHQQWGEEWRRLTKIRSGDHSFPSTWWTTGGTDIPRFALLIGLAALSLSFGAPAVCVRKTLWMSAAVGVLFLVGTVFAEAWPKSKFSQALAATVIRAQLFRSSRLLLILMMAHLAHSIAKGWHVGWRDRSKGFIRGTEGALEWMLATATFVILAVPGLLPLSPYLLAFALVVAVIVGRLSWWQSLIAAAALLVTTVAERTIDYDVPFIDGPLLLKPLQKSVMLAGVAPWVGLGVAMAALVLLRLRVGARARLCGVVAMVFVCAMLGLYGYKNLAQAGKTGAWVAVQEWAAKNTPKDALFMVPPQQGGFRIHSARSVVNEWRDGTQLYFSADFARDWWERQNKLRPAIYDDKGSKELLKVKGLDTMSDQEIMEIAGDYGVTHVVLKAGGRHEMRLKFRAGDWEVYEPRIVDSQEAFMEDVVQPNIEKYRKSDARLELSDATGQTITEGEYTVTQTKQAFGFGCSIPFFAEPAGEKLNDFEPPLVTPKELEMFKAVFNYSVIPFSAKWQRIEPAEGERHYEELDKYVDWCVKNGITMEFHYLSGFVPRWVSFKTEADRKEAWLRHCRETVERYHDRIKIWQVVNDERGAWQGLGDGRAASTLGPAWAAEAFKEIRAKYPDLKLGTSDCSTFFTPYTGAQAAIGLLAGMAEIEAIQAEGAKVDFFSSHGHNPKGCWHDMRQMHECIDAYAAMGLKFHVSEATLDLAAPFKSWDDPNNQKKRTWTPELMADFYEQYFTAAFGHPAVEAINYWDLAASIARGGSKDPTVLGGSGKAGLLDPDSDEARPIYNRLKELIRNRWMTRLSGQVGNDGALAFRGFHGEYEVTVKTAAGKVLRGTFKIVPDSANNVQLKLKEGTDGVAKGE